MSSLRSALLLTLAAGVCACDQTTPGDYEAYDPDAVEDMGDEGADFAPADAQADAAPGPLVLEGNKVLTALAGPSTGRWMWPGEAPGIAAGDAACLALGADHVCEEAELLLAERLGELDLVPQASTIWALENNAMGDRNCRGLSYETADAARGRSAHTVPDGDSFRWAFDQMKDAGFDPACLKDHSVCPQYMPSHQGCNAVRYIPCCG